MQRGPCGCGGGQERVPCSKKGEESLARSSRTLLIIASSQIYFKLVTIIKVSFRTRKTCASVFHLYRYTTSLCKMYIRHIHTQYYINTWWNIYTEYCMTLLWPFFSSYYNSSGINRDLTSTDAHLDPAVTPMKKWYKFTLEWSYYKQFPLKYVFISDSLQVLVRKLVKRKMFFQNNFIWKDSKLCTPAL